MEYVILGLLCITRFDAFPACIPFEKDPVVYYMSKQACEKEAARLTVEMKKGFEADGFTVISIEIKCVEENNPRKSNT